MSWWSGRLRLHRRRIVLDALAQVGPAGMTPNSLEVTTEITEPVLIATLEELVTAGLVTQRVHEGVHTDLRGRRYLLTEHSTSPRNA
jgi:DNA-binding HxlR family transcriptional regulator